MSANTDIFRSELVGVGIFRCPPDHPAFHAEGAIGTENLMVFPRTSVVIEQQGHSAIVADPGVAVLYNSHQSYVRRKLSERGDLCDWFAVRPEVALEALRQRDPVVPARRARPFAGSHSTVSPSLYLRQRRLLHYVQQARQPDPLLVETTVLRLLQALLGADGAPATIRRRRRREVSRAAREYLACRFEQRISLNDVAEAVGCTAFHLARVFRRDVGQTIHGHLVQLRLRSALERLAEPATDLTALALELGFSSHSHFTSAFRRTFGVTPSAFRATASRQRIAELSKILIAR